MGRRLPDWAPKNPKPHTFEEAHDDPAPASICWECARPRNHKVHQEAGVANLEYEAWKAFRSVFQADPGQTIDVRSRFRDAVTPVIRKAMGLPPEPA